MLNQSVDDPRLILRPTNHAADLGQVRITSEKLHNTQ